MFHDRYYIKHNESSEPLVPDDLVDEIVRDGQISFLQLDSAEIATQLTLKDFELFCSIEPTEYIIDVFQLPSAGGTPNLTRFSLVGIDLALFLLAKQIFQ